MSKEKFLSIDSNSQEDITAMFNAVCKEIADKTPYIIKKDLLDFKGDKSEIEKEQPTVQDLLDVLNFYDVKIEFSLKASWVDFKVKDVLPEKEKLLCDKHKELIKTEKKIITNPELSEIIQKETPVIAAEVKVENQSSVNPNNIPDFI